MRVVIIGPGAMGCLFAARLAEGGCDVSLKDHGQDRAAAISRDGIKIEDSHGVRTVRVPVSSDPKMLAAADGVIFMVKAYSTSECAAECARHVNPDAWVMSLQNGLGNTDILSHEFGADRVLAGVSSQGATLTGPGSVRHAGEGDTIIGENSGAITARSDEIATLFSSCGIPTSVTANIKGLLWRKLIVNAAINPITALLRISNGEILRRESLHELMRAAVHESESVARLAEVDLEVPNAFFLVEEVLHKTAANHSSMCQDVVAGRRTEIDFICGAVAREAARRSLPSPINTTFLRLIRAMTEPVLEPECDELS